MTFQPGDDIEAARLNRLQPAPYFAQASTALTKTSDTTYSDITGASITFTTETDNAEYTVFAVFDCAVSTVSATTRMVGRIVTDGTAESGFALHEMDATNRDTVATLAKGTLATAGSHTIKLQGALSAAAGSGTFQVYTQVMVHVFEVA